RRQPDGDVGRLRPDVGLLLLPADVDPDVAGPLLEPNDHPLVHLLARLDEGDPTLLGAGQAISQRGARRRGGQGPIALLAELTHPRSVADRDRAHQTLARGEGQERVAETDQAAGRNEVLEPDPAFWVVDELGHPATRP